MIRIMLLLLLLEKSIGFGTEKNDIVISIGIGFGKNMFRKKYRYRFRKFLVSKKVSVSKNLILVSKNFGIEKSIGFGIEKFWYQKKVSVSFRFLVSSLTGFFCRIKGCFFGGKRPMLCGGYAICRDMSFVAFTCFFGLVLMQSFVQTFKDFVQISAQKNACWKLCQGDYNPRVP